MESELTILSVYHSAESKNFLELNYRLTKELNQDAALTWLIADNTPDDFANASQGGERWQIIRHKSMTAFLQELDPALLAARGSYHHASALNALTPHIQTRYALILDADYYIVRKNWVQDTLAYMKKRGLGIFGSPWHPRWWKKIRHFPAIHSLFLDLAQVPKESLDFRPQHVAGTHRSSAALFSNLIPPRLRNSIQARLQIGSSRDTAYKLYADYANRTELYEYTCPVFKPFAEMSGVSRMTRYFFESLLPERFSYLPRRGTYTAKSFKDRGYPDAAGQGWEEFVWQRRPFGFHLRSTSDRTRRDHKEEFQKLERVLAGFQKYTAL